MRALLLGCFGGSSTLGRAAVGHAGIVAALLVIGGCASQTIEGIDDAEVSTSALCSAASLGVSPNTPGLTGNVTLTAVNPTCGDGETAEFRFQYQPENGVFQNLLATGDGWQTSPSFVWDTSAFPAGRYSLRVQVRVLGGGASSTPANQTVWLGNTCYSVTQIVSPTGTQPNGAAFSFTASATCTTSNSNALYYFIARPVGGGSDIHLSTDWSSSPLMTWDTDAAPAAPAGRYNVIVQAKHTGNAQVESSFGMTVQFGAVGTISSFTTDPAPPFAPPGQLVEMQVVGSCTDGATPEFRFAYRPGASGSYTLLNAGAWVTGVMDAASMDWDTQALALPAGLYNLRYEVRCSDVPHGALQSRTLNFTLGDNYCSAVTLAATPASPPAQPSGTDVTLHATPTCLPMGSALIDYRYTMLKPSGATVILTATMMLPDGWIEDVGEIPDFVVGDVADESGVYSFGVEIRGSGGANDVQATASVTNYKLGDTCAGQNAIVAPTTADWNSIVSVTGSAICGGAATPEYLMAWRAGSSGPYTNFFGWSTTATGTWNTAGRPTGTYTLRVQARADQTFEGPVESTRTHTITLACPSGTVSNGMGGCTDVDECMAMTDDCDDEATCTNTFAGFTCTCPEGTIDVNGDGTDCSSVAQVAGGSGSACAITASGHLYCWGDNASGQLGDGTTTDRLTPVQEDGGNGGWTAVAVGYLHTCGIRAGLLYCWGSNSNGQLGMPSSASTPQLVTSPSGGTWTDVSVGFYHSCGIRNGELYCWGWGGEGELGLGNTTSFSTPQKVGSATDWDSVAAGGYHTCGIQAAGGGTLSCWGYNIEGQLGKGNNVSTNSPGTALTGTWTSIAAGAKHTCAINSANTLYCWGQNNRSMIGDGTTANKNMPALVNGGFIDWSMVGAGTYHTCGIRGTGLLYCWGYNPNGEVGDGTFTRKSSPVPVGAATDWAGLGVGEFHSGGVRGGNVYTWGANTQGQLGNNSTTRSNVPVGPLTFP